MRVLGPLQTAVATDGFVFVEAVDMSALLARSGPLADWARFAGSWNDLALDTYMGDGGRYRRRRHATFEATANRAIVRQPHQPHFQSVDYNTLNGGIARWFEPIDAAVAGGASMTAILHGSRDFFEALSPTRHWHVEAHQFRIEARAGERGRPTPEGVHRDGVDYVLVLLIDRVNIVSGTTTVYAVERSAEAVALQEDAERSAEAVALQGDVERSAEAFALQGDAEGRSAKALAERELGRFTLSHPLDAALLDDARVAHGVTPIEPLDPARPAYRDVLVVTWVEAAKRAASRPGPSAHR